MSSELCWQRVFGPRQEASVDNVGEVAFECPAGFAWRLAFGEFASEVGPSLGVVALLDDRDDVERSIELSVSTRSMRMP